MKKIVVILLLIPGLMLIHLSSTLNAQEQAKKSITFQEGVKVVPGKDGDFDKYTYKKGAFYGYAYQGQAKPHWYNMVMESKIKNLSYKSRQLNQAGHIQGYDLNNLHVEVTFDGSGRMIWKDKSGGTTKGICFTGNYPQKKIISAVIDGVATQPPAKDGHGHFLLHLAPGSKYAFLDSEVEAFAGKKRKGGGQDVQVKKKNGEVVATLDFGTMTATAGSQGMYVSANTIEGSLDLEPGLKYSQTH